MTDIFAGIDNVDRFEAAQYRKRACPNCHVEACAVQTLNRETGEARCRVCEHRFVQYQYQPYRHDWRAAYPELT